MRLFRILPRVASLAIALCLIFGATRAGDGKWRIQLEHYPDTLWLVSAISRNAGWVLGVHGTVLRTTDAGRTWLPVQDARLAGKTPTALAAFTADGALVAASTHDPWSGHPFTPGDTAWIYRTSDGGRSWHEVFRQHGGFFNGVHRLGANGAVCLGNPVDGRWTVVTSADGGIHWTRVATAPDRTGSELGSLGSSAARGERHVWFGALDDRSAGSSSRVYRSTDGGSHWTFSILPFPSPHTLDFNDRFVGIVSTSLSKIARTTDGGESWTIVSLPYDEGSGDVAASPDGQLWLTQHRSVLSSADEGLSWSRVWQVHPAHKIVMKLDFAVEGDSLFGWATTWTGGIARFEGRARSGTQ